MQRISAPRAHAARRAMLAAAGLASAITAHVIAMGDLAVLPVAPALWLMFVALAAVIGTRRRAFAARGLAVTALLVVGSQFVVHAGMTVAPWAFGLQAHHAAPLLTPGMALAHVAAAVVLIAAVAFGERMLAALSRVVGLITGSPRPPALPAVVACIAPLCAVRPPAAVSLPSAPTRGPPVPA